MKLNTLYVQSSRPHVVILCIIISHLLLLLLDFVCNKLVLPTLTGVHSILHTRFIHSLDKSLFSSYIKCSSVHISLQNAQSWSKTTFVFLLLTYYLTNRLQVAGPTGYWSYGPLVLRPIGPTGHWSYGPLVLRAIGPTGHWSYGPLVLRQGIMCLVS